MQMADRSDPPLLDETKLQMLLDLDQGGTALLREMKGLYDKEAPKRLESIRQAIQAGEAKAAMEAAHGLKGAAGLLGAEQVFQRARTMEFAARKGEIPTPESVAQLEGDVAAALSALEVFLARFPV